MQYHIVLSNEAGQIVAVRSAEGRAAADRETRLLLTSVRQWMPTRYPGRSWRRGEVAVYLERSQFIRRELSVLRCPSDHGVPGASCLLRSLGIPALNLDGPGATGTEAAAPAPAPGRAH
jgi:hypothetical protein